MVDFPKYERTQRCKIEELAIFNNSTIFIGIALGDKLSNFDILDKDGEVIEESRIPTTRNAFICKFTHFTPSRIAMEVGPHTRWISQTL